MFRTALSLVCLVAFAGPAFAEPEEVEGTFVKYDKAKMVLTLEVDKKEVTFPVTEETKLYTLAGKPNKIGINGLGLFRTKKTFKLKVEKKEGKTVVLEVRPQRK